MLTKEKNIVFASDKAYFRQLEVTIISILKNCRKEDFLVFYVLSLDLHETDINSLKKYLNSIIEIHNFDIRLYPMQDILKDIRINFYIEIHVSISTYLRFFIPILFKDKDKILYLDSDLIIDDDINKLFEFDLDNYPCAACVDLREEMAREKGLYVSGRKWETYVREELLLEDKHNYFQAGVILFNIKKCLEIDLLSQLLSELERIKTPILSDQDVINSSLKGNIKEIPDYWNVEMQVPLEFKHYLLERGSFAERYLKAFSEKKILHFASRRKPWNDPEVPCADVWWSYAKLSRNFDNLSEELECTIATSQSRKFLYSLIDLFFPPGSRARSYLKKIFRKVCNYLK